MPISFNKVAVNLRTPGVFTEYDASQATTGPGVQPFLGLMIGQKLAAGTQDALTPIRVTSAAQAKTLFGEGSISHRQAVAWFAENSLTEVWAVAFDDPSGSAAATGDIAFTGPATATGTLSLYIGGSRIQTGVTSGDSATDIAAAVVAAIALVSDLPVTAAVNGGDDTQVDFTARNKGTLGNDIDLRFNYFDSEETPAGVGATITAMSGGSGVPDFAPLWAAIGDEHYNIWAMPYTDAASLSAVTDELEDRADPDRQIEALAFCANVDTHSNLGTFGDAQNSPFISCYNPGGNESPTPAFEIGASYAAVEAEQLAIDPARPTQTLELSHVKAPAKDNRFTQAEQNLLLFDGIATGYVDSSGNVRIQRAITFYKENAVGADDTAYLDVNTPATLSYIRWSVRNRLLLKYPRHKLANDGTKFGLGQAIMTPKVMKAELISLFSQWELRGLVEDADSFAELLIVERNADDRNRLDILLPPDLVNQLRIIAIQIQFRV